MNKITLKSDIKASFISNNLNPAKVNIFAENSSNYFVVAKSREEENKTLGGINVISQPLSLKNLYIVQVYLVKSLSENTYPNVDIDAMKNKLDIIYSAIGATFIVLSEKINLNFDLDLDKNGSYDDFDNKERMRLLQLMNSSARKNEVSVYIMNCEIKSKNPSGDIVPTAGFSNMNRLYPQALENPYIILTTQISNIDETLCHEFGHCVFGLDHPFDEFLSKGQQRGQDPLNIMDYARTPGSCGLRAYQILKINQINVLNPWIEK